MLGENGTEQFEIITKVDEREIGRQKIHDPFLHSKTIIALSFLDWAKLLWTRKIIVSISVTGTQGIQRAIMMLDPAELEKVTKEILEDRRISREQLTAVGGFIASEPERKKNV